MLLQQSSLAAQLRRLIGDSRVQDSDQEVPSGSLRYSASISHLVTATCGASFAVCSCSAGPLDLSVPRITSLICFSDGNLDRGQRCSSRDTVVNSSERRLINSFCEKWRVMGLEKEMTRKGAINMYMETCRVRCQVVCNPAALDATGALIR